ncbi:MAG: hypothetical protein JW891_14040, partial [Candidatus Lokiarchaeota archaeon]|nr:hypothetical protein [Candidatus Lokiarchaeota archaeon]
MISAGEDIKIITPGNITYLNPMSGFYPASLGFENKEIGRIDPYSWNINDYQGMESKVIDEKYGHNNVLQQYMSSGNKSLTLTGEYPGWSAEADRQITYTSDLLSV